MPRADPVVQESGGRPITEGRMAPFPVELLAKLPERAIMTTFARRSGSFARSSFVWPAANFFVARQENPALLPDFSQPFFVGRI